MAKLVACEGEWGAIGEDRVRWHHNIGLVGESPNWKSLDANHKMASSLLGGLLDAFSEPAFQVKLQKLLQDAEKSDPGREAVPGRSDLIMKVHADVLPEVGLDCKESMCKLIVPFIHDETISIQLSLIDELLGLAPNASSDFVKMISESSMIKRRDSSRIMPEVSVWEEGGKCFLTQRSGPNSGCMREVIF